MSVFERYLKEIASGDKAPSTQAVTKALKDRGHDWVKTYRTDYKDGGSRIKLYAISKHPGAKGLADTAEDILHHAKKTFPGHDIRASRERTSTAGHDEAPSVTLYFNAPNHHKAATRAIQNTELKTADRAKRAKRAEDEKALDKARSFKAGGEHLVYALHHHSLGNKDKALEHAERAAEAFRKAR